MLQNQKTKNSVQYLTASKLLKVNHLLLKCNAQNVNIISATNVKQNGIKVKHANKLKQRCTKIGLFKLVPINALNVNHQ